MKKTLMLILSLTLGILLLSACGDKDKSDEGAKDDNGEEASEQLPEPDLADIPDVVAKINDEEVSKEEFENIYQQQFQQQAMQAQMTGQEIDQDELKKQTAEGLVGQKLLIQEANSQIDKVSDKDIDKTVDDVVQQNGMETKDELLAAFKEQGMDEKEFMSQIETQVKVDKLIDKEAGDVDPSEDETKEAYETMKAQQEEAGSEEELPKYDEIKPQLEEQLKQQKRAEATQSYVEKLRKDADVKVYL